MTSKIFTKDELDRRTILFFLFLVSSKKVSCLFSSVFRSWFRVTLNPYNVTVRISGVIGDPTVHATRNETSTNTWKGNLVEANFSSRRGPRMVIDRSLFRLFNGQVNCLCLNTCNINYCTRWHPWRHARHHVYIQFSSFDHRSRFLSAA